MSIAPMPQIKLPEYIGILVDQLILKSAQGQELFERVTSLCNVAREPLCVLAEILERGVRPKTPNALAIIEAIITRCAKRFFPDAKNLATDASALERLIPQIKDDAQAITQFQMALIQGFASLAELEQVQILEFLKTAYRSDNRDIRCSVVNGLNCFLTSPTCDESVLDFLRDIYFKDSDQEVRNSAGKLINVYFVPM